MKKLLIFIYIILSTTLTHAGDKWTGPTSPTNPMWGLTGSSLMSEILRDNPPSYDQQLQMQNQERKIRALEDQVDSLKKKQKSGLAVQPWED